LKQAVQGGARAGLVRSASLTNYAEIAQKAGLDPGRMLREFRLPIRALDDTEQIVPMSAVRALLEASAERSGLEAFGLLMGETRRLSNLGPLGLLLREQPTLRGALEAMVAYGNRLNQTLYLTVEEAGDIVVLREEIVVGSTGSVRQSTELAICVAFRILRQVMGPDWRPRRVCFAHDAPADRSVHERIFGRNVEFGHDFNGIVCSRDDLAHVNPDADPAAVQLAQRLFESHPSSSEDASMVAQVREVVVRQLGTGTCSIDRVAQHLGIGRRTIHRRLEREHETFSNILDSVRRELADRYVNEGKRSMTEVSALLGFSALSGFSRWYRRQHGDTAQRARKRTRRG
jgi:AraC-like DNA-binding protein